ncbi:MAG: hypothetical protein AAF721_11780 [Myxococcota bacterium]
MIGLFSKRAAAALLLVVACDGQQPADAVAASDSARAQTGVYFYASVERLSASDVLERVDERVDAIEVELLDHERNLIGVAVIVETGQLLGPDEPAYLGEGAQETLARDLHRALFPTAFRTCDACHVTGEGGAHL